jgi:hypothetical protein
MRRSRTNYAKILGIGLGISLAVHVAVIGLGQWSSGSETPADGTLSVVTLPAPETPPDELEADLASSASGSFDLSIPQVRSTGVDFSEHLIVLAEASSSEINEPLVPKPRINPASVQSDLTPIRVREPALVTLGDRGRQSTGGGGVGIGILVGVGGRGHGDHCAPSAINVRYPTRPMTGANFPNRRITGNFLPSARNQIRMPVRRR